MHPKQPQSQSSPEGAREEFPNSPNGEVAMVLNVVVFGREDDFAASASPNIEGRVLGTHSTEFVGPTQNAEICGGKTPLAALRP